MKLLGCKTSRQQGVGFVPVMSSAHALLGADIRTKCPPSPPLHPPHPPLKFTLTHFVGLFLSKSSHFQPSHSEPTAVFWASGQP